MGWTSGLGLAESLIHAAHDSFPEYEERKKFWIAGIKAFEDMDCDQMMECQGIDDAYDHALREVHGEWFDEEHTD